MWSYGKDPIPPDPSKKSMHTSCCLFRATYAGSDSDTNPGITQNKGRPRGAAGNLEPCSGTNRWRVKRLHFGDVTETVPGEVLLVLPRVHPQPPPPLKKCLQSVNRKGQDSALERERQKLRDEFAWLHVRLASHTSKNVPCPPGHGGYHALSPQAGTESFSLESKQAC